MSAADARAEAIRWLRYAGEDLRAAEMMARSEDASPRHACWLSQQTEEKAIKSVLVYLQIDFPKRHDLDFLRKMIPHAWRVSHEPLDLAILTEWAVEARYPGDWPEASELDALDAVRQARQVYDSVRSDFDQAGVHLEELD